MIAFDEQIGAALKQLEVLLGASPISELLASSYRQGETFATAFAKFYAKILGDEGVVFLNSLDTALHRVVRPLYRSALEKSDQLNQALLALERELRSARYHAHVTIPPSHTHRL